MLKSVCGSDRAFLLKASNWLISMTDTNMLPKEMLKTPTTTKNKVEINSCPWIARRYYRHSLTQW